jgi:hypothetical protein
MPLYIARSAYGSAVSTLSSQAEIDESLLWGRIASGRDDWIVQTSCR